MTNTLDRLRRRVLRMTWVAVFVFIPLETYVTFRADAYVTQISGYIVNIVGAGIALWGALALRKGRPWATGVLAAGWAWTTAVAWRATNTRFWYAAEGGKLDFGDIELWLGPLVTALTALIFLTTLLLLIKGDRRGG